MRTNLRDLHGFVTDERIEAQVIAAGSAHELFDALTDLRDMARRTAASVVIKMGDGLEAEDVRDAFVASRFAPRRLVLVADPRALARSRMTRLDFARDIAGAGPFVVHVETDLENALIGTALLVRPGEIVSVIVADRDARRASDLLAAALGCRGMNEPVEDVDLASPLRIAG